MEVNDTGHGTAHGLQAIARLLLHETRTPLNAIRGFTELLLAGAGGPLGAEALEYVGQVARAARALELGLGHLQDLAALDDEPPLPGEVIDPEAGLARAGFRVTGAEVATGRVRGDPGAWDRLGEACRAYLEAGQRGHGAPLPARFQRAPDGRLALTLAGPVAASRDGTGLLALELASRLARRVGADLRAPAPDRVVVTWLVPDQS